MAPTTPVTCVRAPAASATGVREELLLMGKPWKKPAARLAAPRPTISWFGSTAVRVRAAIGARQHARVRERHHGDRTAADQHRDDVGGREPGDDELGQSLRQPAQHRDVGAAREVEGADDQGGAHHRHEDAGQAPAALEGEDHHERGAADRERRPVGGTAQDPLADSPQADQRAFELDREAEKLRQLADQHGQRDAVHVAVADRLGEQLGDEAEAQHAGQDAHRAGDDRHDAGECHRPHGVAAGQAAARRRG